MGGKMTKQEMRWFFFTQIIIILLLLTAMDCIIRGPLYLINDQLTYADWRHNYRLDVLSEAMEQEAKR